MRSQPPPVANSQFRPILTDATGTFHKPAQPVAGGPKAAVPDARRALLTRRVRLLVAATITYNIIEAIAAISFFALAGYVTIESLRILFGAAEAQPSTVGILLAALSLLIMPPLSHAQRRAGRELGSASALADSQQTLLYTYLSDVLLVGLVLNATVGWSWADPFVALVSATVAVKEGHEAWRGQQRC